MENYEKMINIKSVESIEQHSEQTCQNQIICEDLQE